MDDFDQLCSNSTNVFNNHEHSVFPTLLEPNPDPPPEEGDFSDAILKYLNQLLLEEADLGDKHGMFYDCSALQAAEKSLYDVLGEIYPPSPNPYLENQNQEIESNWVYNQGQFDPCFELSSHVGYTNNLESFGYSNGNGVLDGSLSFMDSYANNNNNQPISQFREGEPEIAKLITQENYVNSHLEQEGKTSKTVVEPEGNRSDNSLNGWREKKKRYWEDRDKDDGSGRSNKYCAVSYAIETEEEIEVFDKVLSCIALNPPRACGESNSCNFIDSPPNGNFEQNEKSTRGMRKGETKEVLNLRTLLTQCAQAVSSSDSKTASALLSRIRKHSSPFGDGNERLAHHFANALEARLAGTGMPLYTCVASGRISTAEFLRAYQVYISACPFWTMSYAFANKTIGNVAKNARRLHIIDFGILYGFQWPYFIQQLSMSYGGPPRLRITGIEFPQPGFRPAERVEDTGRHLATYCMRLKVPFEYNAIAKKWHTIQLEDLKIDADEALVVNCLYRLKNVPDDDTVAVNSPRDDVLNLIKKINPEIFIHGIVNGAFNAPLFVTRFRETLFHFSALFDMFEAIVPREDEQRRLFEKEVFGRDVMNVLACEGTERVERPETIKQWEVRNMRAGFRQLPLDQEIVGGVRKQVKLGYHKDFVVDEDRNWMLQGWKGQIIYALSCWKPVLE